MVYPQPAINKWLSSKFKLKFFILAKFTNLTPIKKMDSPNSSSFLRDGRITFLAGGRANNRQMLLFLRIGCSVGHYAYPLCFNRPILCEWRIGCIYAYLLFPIIWILFNYNMATAAVAPAAAAQGGNSL